MSAAQSPALIDPTDVPPVCPAALSLALALIAPAGAAPDLASLDDDAVRRIEAALWTGGPPCAERTSVMLRLRALASTLTGRRFVSLLKAADDRVVAQAITAAATLRLNVRAGLNPLRLMWAMTEKPAAPVAVLPTRAVAKAAPLPLAA